MNMKISCLSKTDVAEFVGVMLTNSNNDLPWTMTISPDISGGCCAIIAIDGLSDAIVETLGQIYLKQLMTI